MTSIVKDSSCFISLTNSRGSSSEMAPTTVVPDASKGIAKNTNLSDDDAANAQQQLDSAIDSAFSGGQAQERANQARKRAEEASSEQERKKHEDEAAEYERQAQSQLKTSRRLQSGAWQGFGAGAGMGAATGIGLGSVVGTLSGGILAVPLTAVGGLIGAGTGALHGPWIKLTRGEDGPQIASAKEGEPGAIQLHSDEVDALKSDIKQRIEGGSNLIEKATSNSKASTKNKPKPGRKPPKKLQVQGDK
jgi:hypothetical protein